MVGETLTKVFKYNLSSGIVTLVTASHDAKLVHESSGHLIMTGEASLIYYIVYSTDGGSNVNPLQWDDGGGPYTINNIDNFIRVGNKVYFKARAGDTNDYYDIFEVDFDIFTVTPGSGVNRKNISHPMGGATAQSPASLELRQVGSNIYVKRVADSLLKLNSSGTFDTISSQGGLNVRLEDELIHVYDNTTKNYYIYDENASQIDYEDLSQFSLCGIDNSTKLTKNFVFEQCAETPNDVGVYFRSIKQYIKLTSFGFDWAPNETRLEVLYEDSERSVINMINHNSADPQDIYNAKVIEIKMSNGYISFLFNENMEFKSAQITENTYMICTDSNSNQTTGDDLQLLYEFDFSNNRIKEVVSENYQCVGESDFRESYHLIGDYLYTFLRDEDPTKSLGFELYKVKLNP